MSGGRRSAVLGWLPAVLVLAVVVGAVVRGASESTPVDPPAARPLVQASCSQRYLPLPDPACTPGAPNPAVTQATIRTTICTSGWTATIRPPVSYTTGLKRRGIAAYGYTDKSLSDYEEDHFLPLEVGGSPTDPRNLWPEPHSGGDGSYSKDRVENAARRAVCSGRVTLAAAQHAMLTDWTTADSVLGIG